VVQGVLIREVPPPDKVYVQCADKRRVDGHSAPLRSRGYSC
jgi:hypothetical protein